MLSTDSTRALLGPADPARGMPTPEPVLPATVLIGRAGATSARRFTPGRAIGVALAATAAVAAAVVLVPGDEVPRSTTKPPVVAGPRTGDTSLVVTPVAFTITTNPPSASAELRALAKRIGEAPYDARTGRYSYVKSRTWGDPTMSSENGKYSLGYTHEDERWQAADRPGVQRTTMLPYEFPDEASRDHYGDMPPPDKTPSLMPIDEVGAVPTDRAALARRLNAGLGTGAVAKAVATAYTRYPLSRANRAMVLDILADEKGFRWRGEVTDRAGREGVAITGDERDGRSVLIFDPATGALLASEYVILGTPTPRLSAYQVLLAFDRRDDPPAVPPLPTTAPTVGGPPTVN